MCIDSYCHHSLDFGWKYRSESVAHSGFPGSASGGANATCVLREITAQARTTAGGGSDVVILAPIWSQSRAARFAPIAISSDGRPIALTGMPSGSPRAARPVWTHRLYADGKIPICRRSMSTKSSSGSGFPLAPPRESSRSGREEPWMASSTECAVDREIDSTSGAPGAMRANGRRPQGPFAFGHQIGSS